MSMFFINSSDLSFSQKERRFVLFTSGFGGWQGLIWVFNCILRAIGQ